MATGIRTGIKYDYTIGDKLDTDDQNNMVRFVDNAIARLLMQYMLANGVLTAATNPLQINTTTKRFTAPTGDAVVAGLIKGRAFYMDATHESTGTVVSGSTTWLEDNSLVQADGFWIGGYVILTSGTYSGQVRKISAFDSSSGRVSWVTPLAGAPSAGDTFTVTFWRITGLTNGALNYVYGVAGDRTSADQIIEWQANTTGTAPAASIYVATVTLDGSGLVTASDNNPSGSDRVAYMGIGAFDVDTETGTISSLAPGGSTQFTVSHDHMLYRGGIECTLGDENASFTVDEHWKPDEIVVTISNDSGYTLTDLTYSIMISGWKRRYFSV